MSGQFKKGLNEIVQKYKLDIRLTPNQDLLLCNIGSEQLSSVKDSLEKIGIKNPDNPSIISRHAIACPALPLCGLAITEAERYLPKLIKRIEDLLKRLDIQRSILIRVTGCPNGCARPYMAEIGLVGSGVNQYQLWLGGTPNLKKLAKPYLHKLQLSDLEAAIQPLLLDWKSSGGESSFGEHIGSKKDQSVMDLISGGLDCP